MTSDTTKADQQAELKRQAFVISEVERAHKEELPGLGADNGVPNAVESEPEAIVRSVSVGPTRATEPARDKGA